MEITREYIKSKVAEFFDYSFKFNILDIYVDILSDIDEDDILLTAEDNGLTDIIIKAIDNNLIYTDDQWEMMKHHQTPGTADWLDCYDIILNDVIDIIRMIREDKMKI